MNPRYDFTGQVATVTGGSSGMGLATARAPAEAGAAGSTWHSTTPASRCRPATPTVATPRNERDQSTMLSDYVGDAVAMTQDGAESNAALSSPPAAVAAFRAVVPKDSAANDAALTACTVWAAAATKSRALVAAVASSTPSETA